MNTSFLFRGTATALVTPFDADGAVDENAFRRLIEYQIAGGVEALVVLGTTGESPTVTGVERTRLVAASIEQADGRVPVIVGTGSNATNHSIAYAREAARLGADGQLVVGPYYNKPSQAGFRAHITALAEATDCPIILYNVPGRTSFNSTAETVLQLAEEVPTIVGIKEASGNLAQISDILAYRPAHLAVYAGDDEVAFPLLAMGGDGVVSVIGNALPERFSALIRLGLEGNLEAARAEQWALLPAMRACFFETNPVPIKAVMAELGLMEPGVRLPLVELPEPVRTRVHAAFAPVMPAVSV